MNIAIGSAWRDSAGNLPRYETQVADLTRRMPQHRFRIIAVEGDSRDITPMALANRVKQQWLNWELVTCNHGQRKFGSTEDADRMVAMSKVGNAIFDAVKTSDDILVYVESDLVWDATDVAALIDQVADFGSYQVIAPMIYSAPDVFYDVWGFRGMDGRRFSPFKPYHWTLEPGLNGVSSVGSCLVMLGDIARKARILNDYCLVGWCENARALGARIAVDTRYKVRHP